MLFVTVISLGLLAIGHGQCALKTIAFSVVLSHNQIVGANQAVIYDNVLLNHGNAYEGSTGIFTAPVDGLYSFQVSLLTIWEKDAWLGIFHNDQLKVSVFAQKGNNNCSNSVIVKMKEGDRVNVRAHREAGLYGRPIELYNTFSGQFLSGL